MTGEYLMRSVAHSSFGGKVFCAFKVLGIEESDNNVNEYLYAVCQEYLFRNGRLEEGQGLAGPVALYITNEAGSYRILYHKIPGDGGRYAQDIKRIFPAGAQDEIFSPETGAKLLQEVRRQAEANY